MINKCLISIDKWRNRFLELSELIATWSKDPSTKVGAVLITLDGRVASTGYNGLPYSIDDNLISNREFKIKHVIHAEANAIANRYFLNEDCLLFVSKPICVDCVKQVMANRFIKGVCWLKDDEFAKRWNLNESIEMLELHFGQKVTHYENCSFIIKP